MYMIGYGDIHPDNEVSRVVVIVIICTSLLVIPIQVQKLAVLVQATSRFRQPLKRSKKESHVIICGNITDRAKLERFLKEFYHPSRVYTRDQLHTVIISSGEPTDDIRDLLFSVDFQSHLTYISGSALNVDDLNKADLLRAKAVFFFGNSAVDENSAILEDSANVLRVLSITNLNPKIECFVEMMKSGDRQILKNSLVDVILCYDEYRTSLQARNALCPGIATLIDNLFTTFGESDALPLATSNSSNSNSSSSSSNVSNNKDKKKNDDSTVISWTDDYIRGAEMEVYYIEISQEYYETMGYIWSLVTEGIYLEFNCMLIGVCCSDSHNVILNPSNLETKEFDKLIQFYTIYHTGILICDSYEVSMKVQRALKEVRLIEKIVLKLLLGMCFT